MDLPSSVTDAYDVLAQQGSSNLCCRPELIYSPAELARMPQEVALLSSGCGHPVRFSPIAPGATVLDIGSGAGPDCILAAELVGPSGEVIGVDPSLTMRSVAERHARDLGLPWVRFVDGDANELPVADATVDVIISNCVLSLAALPEPVWSEIERVLRPGGHFSISDTIGGDPGVAPSALDREQVDAKIRCEAGVSWATYVELFDERALTDIYVLGAGPAEFGDGTWVQGATVRGAKSGATSALHVELFTPRPEGVTLARDAIDVAVGPTADVTWEVHNLASTERRNALQLMVDGPVGEDAVLVVDGVAVHSWAPSSFASDPVTRAVARRLALRNDRRGRYLAMSR